MEKLQQNLQYTFSNIKLLQQALTHSSVTRNEHFNYERLEFLGDRVLGMTIAAMLYKMFPNDTEGSLAQRYVKLVCADAVAEVVKKMHINDYILVADDTARHSINVLCDVGEAVIGAIFLDSSVENAMSFVERNWNMMIDSDFGSSKDFKTRLQERFHSEHLASPVYEMVSKEGSEHQPVFKVRVVMNDEFSAYGSGKNKKAAEQQAAENLLHILDSKK
jgi:ribonuclease-3